MPAKADEKLINDILRLVADHEKENGKLLRAIRFRWKGWYMLDGFTVEYKHPKAKSKK